RRLTRRQRSSKAACRWSSPGRPLQLADLHGVDARTGRRVLLRLWIAWRELAQHVHPLDDVTEGGPLPVLRRVVLQQEEELTAVVGRARGLGLRHRQHAGGELDVRGLEGEVVAGATRPRAGRVAALHEVDVA